MLSPGDEALVQVIDMMNLTPLQLEHLANTPGWRHLGLASSTQHSHVYCTCLLEREKSPKDLYLQVLTLTPRITTLVGALCVMEFEGTDGYHPHCHILFDKPAGFRKSNLIRSITRALKLPRPECVDILMSNKVSDYHRRRNYTLGIKADDSKAARVLNDRQIREDNEIPHSFIL